MTMALTTATNMLAHEGNKNKANEEPQLVEERWDKVFPLSEKVNHRKVEFKNQYGITLVGDLYTPKVAATGWLLRCADLLVHQRNSRADSMP